MTSCWTARRVQSKRHSMTDVTLGHADRTNIKPAGISLNVGFAVIYNDKHFLS